MDGDVFTDQEDLPIHGIRDVRSTVAATQHDWSEQAEPMEINALSNDLKSYTNLNEPVNVCIERGGLESRRTQSLPGAGCTPVESASAIVRMRNVCWSTMKRCGLNHRQRGLSSCLEHIIIIITIIIIIR